LGKGTPIRSTNRRRPESRAVGPITELFVVTILAPPPHLRADGLREGLFPMRARDRADRSGRSQPSKFIVMAETAAGPYACFTVSFGAERNVDQSPVPGAGDVDYGRRILTPISLNAIWDFSRLLPRPRSTSMMPRAFRCDGGRRTTKIRKQNAGCTLARVRPQIPLYFVHQNILRDELILNNGRRVAGDDRTSDGRSMEDLLRELAERKVLEDG